MGIEPPPLRLQSPVPSAPPAPSTATTSLAPGFRFHPTDQELVSYYLRRKICGKRVRFDAITETDIYKSEPWDLPAYSRLKSRDNEWYFFGVQDKKYVNGSRVNRATGNGYWKATGNDRPILHNSRTVGMKKTLVYYSGRAPCGKRTNWVMHEYRLTDEEVAKDGVSMDSYLLCKILKKSGPGFKPGEQYGPFVEEEWEREESVLIPGEDVEDGTAQVTDSSRSRRSASEHRPQTLLQHPASGGLSTKTQTLFLPCKVEIEAGCIMDDRCPPEPFPVVPCHKKLRYDPNSCLSSEISTTKIIHQYGACSSSTATTITNTNLSLEFPFFDSVKTKEEVGVASGSIHTQSSSPISIIDINVPPSYLKLFEDMRNEIYKISIEKESLKIEVMSARTMISILQSKVDHLAKENKDLKRIV